MTGQKSLRLALGQSARQLCLVVLTFAAFSGAASAVEKGDSIVNERIQANKMVARRWSEELWGSGRLVVADEIISADYVRHDPGDPFPVHGPADVKRMVRMLRAMLPDLRIEVEMQIAEGEFVVNRYVSTATDTVGYMGMPPTGRTIHTAAIQIFRIVDDKIVESWAIRDDAGTLRQLGHLPTVAPSSADVTSAPEARRGITGGFEDLPPLHLED